MKDVYLFSVLDSEIVSSSPTHPKTMHFWVWWKEVKSSHLSSKLNCLERLILLTSVFFFCFFLHFFFTLNECNFQADEYCGNEIFSNATFFFFFFNLSFIKLKWLPPSTFSTTPSSIRLNLRCTPNWPDYVDLDADSCFYYHLYKWINLSFEVDMQSFIHTQDRLVHFYMSAIAEICTVKFMYVGDPVRI